MGKPVGSRFWHMVRNITDWEIPSRTCVLFLDKIPPIYGLGLKLFTILITWETGRVNGLGKWSAIFPSLEYFDRENRTALSVVLLLLEIFPRGEPKSRLLFIFQLGFLIFAFPIYYLFLSYINSAE